MQNWNFHGYIALPLEKYGNKYIGSSFNTADEIECGEFVNAMINILLIKLGSFKDIKDFISLCEDYTDLPAIKIPKEKAIEMFDKFKHLVDLEK